MSQPLPTKGFKCLSEEEIQELFGQLMELDADGEDGYILEVDLEIPQDKHDYFNHYVPAPEHIDVPEEILSPFNKFCIEKLHLNLATIFRTGHEVDKHLQGYWIQTGGMAEEVH